MVREGRSIMDLVCNKIQLDEIPLIGISNEKQIRKISNGDRSTYSKRDYI